MRGEKRRTRPCCRGSGVFRGAGSFPLAEMSKVPNMVAVVPAMDGPGLSQLDSWADIDKIGISGAYHLGVTIMSFYDQGPTPDGEHIPGYGEQFQL